MKIGEIFTIFILLVASLQSQIYLRHGLLGDEDQIYRLFYDIKDGYYVDIGAYDPILYSTTITLYSNGWNGINIEASPIRSARFPYGKPNDINLNYAAGQGSKFVTLYDRTDDPSMSTLIPETIGQKKQQQNQGNQTKKEQQDKKKIKNYVKVNVPSISMKQLCQKILIKTPNFLSLDVQGYGSAVLLSNDWNTPKCRPDVIMSQFNALSKISGLKSPKQILQQKGYQFFMDAGINQVFIVKQKFQFYKNNYQKSRNVLSQMRIATFQQALKLVKKDLQLKYEQNFIDNSVDPIYLHYPKEGSIVNLIQVNSLSNQICELKNRPIVIFLFNPFNTLLAIPNAKYQVKKIKLGESLFTHITIVKQNKQKFVVYIYDREIQQSKYGSKMQPYIISTSQAQIIIPQSTFKFVLLLIIFGIVLVTGVYLYKKNYFTNSRMNTIGGVELSSTEIK